MSLINANRLQVAITKWWELFEIGSERTVLPASS